MAEEKAYLGSIKVKVDVPNIEFRNRERLREFRRYMRGVHEQGIDKGRDILKRILRDKRAVDTGKLMRSVASRLFFRTTDIYSGDIHFNEPGKEYAYFVEHGRAPTTKYDEETGRPWLPPKEAITKWASRHGITSKRHIYNIRLHIALYGTEGKHFMDEAEREIQRNYSKLVDRAVEKYKRTIK